MSKADKHCIAAAGDSRGQRRLEEVGTVDRPAHKVPQGESEEDNPSAEEGIEEGTGAVAAAAAVA